MQLWNITVLYFQGNHPKTYFVIFCANVITNTESHKNSALDAASSFLIFTLIYLKSIVAQGLKT